MHMRFNLLVLLAVCAAADAATAQFPTPLPAEPTPHVVSLPERYPSNWMFLHDVHFASLIDGRLALVDLTAPVANLKGQVPASQLATFLEAPGRRELYVAETFYSRGTRGQRTDVITIYDMASLAPKGEIDLPGGKRGQFIPLKTTFQMSADERRAFLFNFTPAASVTVVDLEQRRVLSDVGVPGCSLIYPTGKQGFATLCGDGTLSTIRVGAAGEVLAETRSEPFNDIDRNPLFMFHATIDGIAYSPTYLGDVRPLDLRGEQARVMPAWPLATEQERASGWRPSGWQVVSSDDAGRLYVLMQSDGREGSHKQGGTEVWVFDARSHRRLQRIQLAERSISIEITHGQKPRLAAARGSDIDVYDAGTGRLERSLGAQIAHDPMVLHAVR
jgi:methylamine dehydrogenase heavy chain